LQCPECRHPSPADKRFCSRCGEALPQACPGCGSALPGGASFCPSCGRAAPAASILRDRPPRSYTPRHLADRILNSRSALEGERKDVTVLFVDVQGSMEISERIEPEEWHAVLDRFFAILAEGVHHFEGTINQYTGDGIMALFGAPLAHEDHARRACHAALHLARGLRAYAKELRSSGIELAVRMGLNSGEVVVGKIGDDLRMDYTAQGFAVGLAARLQQLAAGGEILVTGSTARLVEGFFELEDLGKVKVKGSRKPVRTLRLLGPGALRSRFDLSRRRGLTPLVGRGKELARLEALLSEVESGSGRAAAVVGDAGVGKSRLCWQLAELCRARGLDVLEAQCPSHGRGVPFLPVLDLLRALLGVEAFASGGEIRERVTRAMREVDRALEDRLPLLFDFLGAPDPERPAPGLDPGAWQRELVGLLRRLLLQRTRVAPILVVIEDLHWIDSASEAFLAQVCRIVPDTRSFLLVDFRPEYSADWLDPLGYARIELGPLGPEDSRELLQRLLGDDPSVVPLAERIQERTAGNPFFSEEVVRSLFGTGALEGKPGAARLAQPLDAFEIPASLRTVLASRIDQLPEHEKTVLQLAAVVGRRLARKLIERVVDAPEGVGATLGALQRRELLVPLAAGGEERFGFAHPLIQEVAYRSQLAAQRKERHARVAVAIDELAKGDPGEQAALVAQHWEQAGEMLRAAAVGARAARWSGLSDAGQSFRQWQKVRELAEALPETPETRKLCLRACSGMLNFGWREGLAPEDAYEIFTRGSELAREAGDPTREALLHGSYGRVLSTVESSEAYLEHARQAAFIARTLDDPGSALLADSLVVQALRHVGRLEEGLAGIEDVLERAGGDPRAANRLGFSPYLWLLGQRAETLLFLGRLADAESDLRRLREGATEWHQVDLIDQARGVWVHLHWMRGDTDAALGEAREFASVAEARASPYSVVRAAESLGMAALLAGEAGKAVEAFERARAAAREHRVGLEFEARTLAQLAEARLALGELAEARRIAQQAQVVGEKRGTRLFECEALLALASVLLREGSDDALERADAALGRAGRLVEWTGAAALEPFVCLERSDLARARGDAEREHAARVRARELFDTMGATPRAARVGDG
jgi:class 3 adenylate cyclase/tetratricopeptide (TPR) repeat protein